MGEIKSTLDLVMERTKHLSMTDDEKARQRQQDFEKQLGGLLLRYGDGALPLDAARAQIAELQRNFDIDDTRPVVDAILARIDPDLKNRAWLELSALFAPEKAALIADLLARYSKDKEALFAKCRQQGAGRLAAIHGISGSAVIPNPEKDPACAEQMDGLKKGVLSRITGN